MIPAYLNNSSFHPKIPGLQLAWDSTSSGALKTCPRYYQLSIVEGWASSRQQVHLEFGILVHSGLEVYDHQRARGIDHGDALDVMVDFILRQTWDSELQRPWTTDSGQKNRFTLLRSLVWYLDQFKDEAAKVVILANGKPATELSFRFELDLAPEGDPANSFLACGHMDRLVQLDDAIYIRDVKTTQATLADEYFAQFTPDNQFSWYTMAGKIIYGIPIRGIMVDAIQVAVGFSRFERRLVSRTEDQISEWYSGLKVLLRQAESYARAAFWPMNEKACFRCAFREVCSKSPNVRQQWLEQLFRRRIWDPLQTRGEP